ncbi:copper resistance D family protein [Arthrobacter sp.]|uniref:copper resistance D family protein n=1 Tax=Arthrobacter sp. TaxID=1667 RepID=UPI003A94938B
MTSMSPPTGPLRRSLGIVGVIALTAVVLTGALSVAGTAAPRVLGDPGTLVRWGLPAALAVHHVALAVALGALAFARGVRPISFKNPRVSARLVAAARWAALTWAASASAVLAFTFADTLGQPLSIHRGVVAEFGAYAWGTEPGRARVVVLAVALVVLVLLMARPGGDAHLVALAVAATVVMPLSMDGHALSTHVPWASTVLALHVLGVAVWVGGVIVLGLLSDLLRPGQSTAGESLGTFKRFSLLAGVAYAAVFASGVATAVLRIGSLEALLTSYGILVLVKTGAMLGLGVIGYLHRRWIVAALHSGKMPTAPVWRLISLEILVMTSTMAVAAVLGRTVPPGT